MRFWSGASRCWWSQQGRHGRREALWRHSLSWTQSCDYLTGADRYRQYRAQGVTATVFLHLSANGTWVSTTQMWEITWTNQTPGTQRELRRARKNSKTCEKQSISPAYSETTEGKIQNGPASQWWISCVLSTDTHLFLNLFNVCFYIYTYAYTNSHINIFNRR